MRKILLLMLVCIISLFVVCGCESNKEYNVVGLYVNDKINENGYQNLYLVIDFDSQGKNIERISDDSNIKLTIGKNTYNIVKNDIKTTAISSKHTFYSYSYFERVTGYYYLNGKGTILGKDDKIKFFANFLINPEDLKSKELQLSINDKIIKYKFENAKNINFMEEILKNEKNYEKSYTLASFIWRVDNAFQTANFLRGAYGKYGDKNVFGLVYRSLYNQFDLNQNGGLPFAEYYDYCPNIIDYFSSFESDLPVFDLDIIFDKYSDSKELINQYIEDVKNLASCLMDPTTTDAKASKLLNQLNDDYKKLCESLAISPLSVY